VDFGLSLPRLLLRLARYRVLLVLAPVLAAIVAATASALSPGEYTALARLLPPRTNTATAPAMLNQIGGTETLGASALTLKSPSELYASLFLSRSVQDSVIARFHLGRDRDIDMDGLRQELAKRTKVDVREDGIIELRYVDDEPERAAAIVNAMIDAVYRKAEQLSRKESANRLAFYDQIIGETRDRLARTERALQAMEAETGYTRLKGQEEATSLTAAELESTLLSRETQLARMRMVATDAHPAVRRLRAEIAALRADRAAMNTAHTAADGVVLPIGALPDLMARIEPLRRDARIQAEVLDQLMKARQLSRVDEKRDLSNVQVLDPAVPPTRASGPRTLRNGALAGAIAFVLALMACLAWDALVQDRRHRRKVLRILRPYARVRRGARKEAA
jgi:uncharacterized protein involved in exopolysaccharide biosynthesis